MTTFLNSPHTINCRPDSNAGPLQLRSRLNWGNIWGGPFDRTGDELRKKRHIQRVVQQVARWRILAAVDIDDVTDALKRVERDADR